MWLRQYPVLCLCLFFKQKTAYEMRISDWSSDVCSSDLGDPRQDQTVPSDGDPEHLDRPVGDDPAHQLEVGPPELDHQSLESGEHAQGGDDPRRGGGQAESSHDDEVDRGTTDRGQAQRSEEHTSELQSLMRISYAV